MQPVPYARHQFPAETIRHAVWLHLRSRSKAIQYALTRWDALTRYGSKGRHDTNGNPAEGSLRGIALTRKSFLFLGSDAGGTRAAILDSVLKTAKLNGLDSEAYLAGVMAIMAPGHPITCLSEILPWEWTPASQEIVT